MSSAEGNGEMEKVIQLEEKLKQIEDELCKGAMIRSKYWSKLKKNNNKGGEMQKIFL